MLEPIMYCTTTMIAHTASAPFWPKLLKKICAMGCELPTMPSMSVPMQNASDTLIAVTVVVQHDNSERQV